MEEDFDVKACNDEFDRVKVQIEMAMNPPMNYKGERVYNSEILEMLPDLQTVNKMTEKMIKGLEMEEDFKLENLKTPPMPIQKPDYKAKYEESEREKKRLLTMLEKASDDYMNLAVKYHDLVDKHLDELKR